MGNPFRNVRTFCTADTVIKSQLRACQQILEMLGAPLVTFLAFQEIQVKVLGIIKEEQEKKDNVKSPKFGVEKPWEPPAKNDKSVGELERNNPFA